MRRFLNPLFQGLFLGIFLSGCASAPEADEFERVDVGVFSFSDWSGPEIDIHYAEPSHAAADAPVIIVMHGVNRNADDYRDNWIDLADEYGLAIYAPEFDAERFPRAASYNLGGLDRETGRSFDAIEPLFDAVKERQKLTSDGYYLFGHSAGGQFVHRFVMLADPKRLKLALAANSGWYTLPSEEQAWPYGLAGREVGADALDAMFERPMIVLLGDKDTDSMDPNLRRTPEAMEQGENRFERGHYFMRVAERAAAERGQDLAWQSAIVNGVDHDNRGMAVFAAEFIAQHDAAHK